MAEPRSDIKTPRWHNGAESRFMAAANGWVMVRRPGCIPYTIFEKEWLALPLADVGRDLHEKYTATVKAADHLPAPPDDLRIDRRRE